MAGTAVKGELGLKEKKNYTNDIFVRIRFYHIDEKDKKKGGDNHLPEIKYVSVGQEHMLAITAEKGQLFGWGDGIHGKLGYN